MLCFTDSDIAQLMLHPVLARFQHNPCGFPHWFSPLRSIPGRAETGEERHAPSDASNMDPTTELVLLDKVTAKNYKLGMNKFKLESRSCLAVRVRGSCNTLFIGAAGGKIT